MCNGHRIRSTGDFQRIRNHPAQFRQIQNRYPFISAIFEKEVAPCFASDPHPSPFFAGPRGKVRHSPKYGRGRVGGVAIFLEVGVTPSAVFRKCRIASRIFGKSSALGSDFSGNLRVGPEDPDCVAGISRGCRPHTPVNEQYRCTRDPASARSFHFLGHCPLDHLHRFFDDVPCILPLDPVESL